MFDTGCMAVPHPGRIPASPLPTTPDARSIPVLPPLRALLPGGGLRPGSVVSVTGSVSLMLALLAEASSTAWCAVCCLPALGAIAAAEMGVRLDHLVAVPVPPAGPAWPKVVAALLDGFDLVVVRPPHPATARETRSLTARARERRTVLLILGQWDGAELRVSVADPEWVGVGGGYGHLRGRAVTVRMAGRGAASQPRERRLWLPGPSGSVEPMEAEPAPDQWLGPARVELLTSWGWIGKRRPAPAGRWYRGYRPRRGHLGSTTRSRSGLRPRHPATVVGDRTGHPSRWRPAAGSRPARHLGPVTVVGRPGRDTPPGRLPRPPPRIRFPPGSAPGQPARPSSDHRSPGNLPGDVMRQRAKPGSPARTAVVWCPDWPITAAGIGPDIPAAVIEGGRVLARSDAAKAEGVTRGQRQRDAQRRCVALVVIPRDHAREVAAFEDVVITVEGYAPRVDVLRPGLCAFRSDAPSRHLRRSPAAAAHRSGAGRPAGDTEIGRAHV